MKLAGEKHCKSLHDVTPDNSRKLASDKRLAAIIPAFQLLG
jgi:hypothetical protein